MPFAARKHDDNTWRLCLRMGATFDHAQFLGGRHPIGPFPSQAKTKACADKLNERWKEYAAAVKRNDMPEELTSWFLAQIDEHGGLGAFEPKTDPSK